MTEPQAYIRRASSGARSRRWPTVRAREVRCTWLHALSATTARWDWLGAGGDKRTRLCTPRSDATHGCTIVAPEHTLG